MTDREVMQMALDWFHWFQHGTNPNGAHVLEVEDALRTALAQPDVPESCCGETKPVALQDDEIYDAAFSAYCKGENSRELFRIMWGNRLTCSIGWDREELKSFARNIAALYTAPPRREWVGLTDDEYELMAEKRVTNYFFNTLDYAHDIEAMLKEKNGG